MLSLIRRYRLILSLILVTIFAVSFLAKDLHEIFVKHQYVSCSDHTDDSFTHFHATEHSVDNCLICNFVIAPVLCFNENSIKLLAQVVYSVYNPYQAKILFNRTVFAYLLRGPPGLA